MPRGRLWEDSTDGEDADSHCVPPALRNTPPALLWILRGKRLCPPYASRKGGDGHMCSRFLAQTDFFVSSACGQHTGVQALPVECPIQGCG